MPTTPPEILSVRARIASLTRSRQVDDPDLVAARRELAELRIARFIRETVAAAPPLTDEQRTRLADLLRPGSAALVVPA